MKSGKNQHTFKDDKKAVRTYYRTGCTMGREQEWRTEENLPFGERRMALTDFLS